MQVPSGRIFTEDDLALVSLMASCKFVDYREEPFMLRSGIESHVYVFGREDLTDNPHLEWQTGRKIAKVILEEHTKLGETDKTPCLVGIPVAGTALAQAASMVSFAEEMLAPSGRPICHRIMRETLKEYGAHRKWVQGDPSPEHVYWSVDNAVTDGRSKFVAAEKFAESGYPSLEMPSLIFVDRQQGGVRRMKERGFQKIVVVFYLLDITFVLRERGVWPRGVIRSVEEEIQAHQFI